jgi:hypothetical protein
MMMCLLGEPNPKEWAAYVSESLFLEQIPKTHTKHNTYKPSLLPKDL